MTDRPNILLVFPDQWRWDWLGCDEAGVPVRTPNIDALAGRGARFTQCRTNSPVCAPARACLSTGMRYERCGVPSNAEVCDPARTTVWQLLRDAGYRVGTCGKNDLHKGDHRFTRSGWQPLLGALGFTEAREHAGKWDFHGRARNGEPEQLGSYLARHGQLEAYMADMDRRRQINRQEQRRDHAPMALPRRFYTDDLCGANAVELIENFPADAPWALWVNFPGPHEPFDPPRELQARYDGVDFPPPVAPGESADDHQQLRRNYAAMIEGIDDWVGWMLAAIERRGELDDTLVVFCSDHGELLGDHGLWYKSRPQEGSVRVPLVVAGPGVAAGRRSASLVELIDVGATMLDAAGITPPAAMDARSLLPVASGGCADGDHRDVQLMALADWRAICDGRFKYVRYDDGSERLWDLIEDPTELNDLATSHPEVAAGLRERLEAESAVPG